MFIYQFIMWTSDQGGGGREGDWEACGSRSARADDLKEGGKGGAGTNCRQYNATHNCSGVKKLLFLFICSLG